MKKVSCVEVPLLTFHHSPIAFRLRTKSEEQTVHTVHARPDVCSAPVSLLTGINNAIFYPFIQRRRKVLLARR